MKWARSMNIRSEAEAHSLHEEREVADLDRSALAKL